MSEDNAQQSNKPVVADAPQSLDDVISEFNVVPQEAEPQNNVAEFAPAQQQHIDPYDESALNKWATDATNSQNVLQQQVQELTSKLNKQDQLREQTLVDADIKKAVEKITNSVEGIDPLMAELYIEKRATEHAGFKAAWDNRGKNPKAFDAALSAVAGELDGRFQRVDTQLAENHRAATQSTQSNSTQKSTSYGNSMEEALAKATTESERSYIWNNFKSGGY